VIMVEGFNESGTYDFNYIKSYIYTNFYSAYPNEEFFLNNNPRPLLCWWNQRNMTDPPTNRAIIDNSSDALFYNRIVGQSSYVDWYAWRPCSVDPNETPVINSNDGVVVIEPRYDGSHIGQGAGSVFDPTYSQGLYDKQWNYILENTEKIKCVIIYSWNEYHERSQIEPKNDSTSIYNDPYYIQNKTKSYIDKLNSIPEFPSFLILPLFMIVTLIAVAFHKRACSQKESHSVQKALVKVKED
jgi:hypothetical protein